MSDEYQDIQEIIRICHIHARGLDRMRPDDTVASFTEDAFWDATALGLKRLEGMKDLRAFFQADAETMAESIHLVTNHVVQVTGAESANGTHYVFTQGLTKDGASLVAGVLNEDLYRRTDQGWKICGRTLTPLTTAKLEGFDA